MSFYRVKHISEVTGKSTATHAKILSPDCVDIYQFPVSESLLQKTSLLLSTGTQDMPKYDKETTVLVYPKEVLYIHMHWLGYTL